MEQWMSWEGGVDLIAQTQEGAAMPNVILHIARMVHTPVGSAPSGMILWQPDATAPPQVMGFVSEDAKVGAYFGPNIFAGTPFENAPVLDAQIEVFSEAATVGARVTIGEWVFESQMTNIGTLELVNREPGMLPFAQQGLEAAASSATLKVNGQNVDITLPAQTMTGAPAALWAPCGLYAR